MHHDELVQRKKAMCWISEGDTGKKASRSGAFLITSIACLLMTLLFFFLVLSARIFSHSSWALGPFSGRMMYSHARLIQNANP